MRTPDFDRWIESPQYAQDWLRLNHVNPETGDIVHAWEAYARRECGAWFLVDDDNWHCPECGAEGKMAL